VAGILSPIPRMSMGQSTAITQHSSSLAAPLRAIAIPAAARSHAPAATTTYDVYISNCLGISTPETFQQ
jgi:hypothetical protein